MNTVTQDKSDARPIIDSAIRTILVHVEPGEAGAARLRVSADLARKLDATLFGLAAEAIPPLGSVDPSGLMVADWYQALSEQVQKNFDFCRDAFHEAAKGLRTEFAWIQDMPADALARAARAADLILATGYPPGDRYRRCDAAEVMLQAGRPVLIAPPSVESLNGEAVVIAWKDTREARRALADALPLLRRARTVIVVEVCGKDAMADAELRTKAVVAGLKRHEIKAEARVVAAPPERVVTELMRLAEAIDSDLIVAGGYGHSRVGEWVFGGVTRDLLLDPQGRYVLLSH